MTVYLAARNAPPLVPWDAERPAFNVIPLTDHDEPVRMQFSMPHIVYVGSHQGCGCGFAYGRWEVENSDEVALAHASVAALRAYVTRIVAAGGPVELYASWDGDQAKSPAHHLTLTPDELGGPSFWFEERTFAIISPAG